MTTARKLKRRPTSPVKIPRHLPGNSWPLTPQSAGPLEKFLRSEFPVRPDWTVYEPSWRRAENSLFGKGRHRVYFWRPCVNTTTARGLFPSRRRYKSRIAPPTHTILYCRHGNIITLARFVARFYRQDSRWMIIGHAGLKN